MSDNEGEGPSSVQFRGLSTHYVATDNMLASFRYPAGSYSARPEDWVGLFEEGATAIEHFLAKAHVRNTATHRPCDGGLWKAGKVVLRISQLQGPSSSGYYRLWYVSHETGGVVGRSATFTLCRDMSEFPSITIEGCEDHALLNSLREQSPISVRTEHCISSSFVLVEDEGWSWDGEDPPATPPAGGEEATAILEPALERESPELTTTSPDTSEPPTPCEDQQSEEHLDHSRESTHSLPEPKNVSGIPKLTETLTEELASGCPDHGVAPPSGVREGPPSLSFLQEASLTNSTVVVHSLSQREAWRIKNNNKELWAKVQKLDAGMEGMQRRQQELEACLAREETEKKALQERVSELVQVEAHLRGELRRAEKEKQELCREKTTLQERVGELQTEVGVVSQHCTQLVEKISEYETQLAVAHSEQEVLRQRQGQRHKGESSHSGRRGHSRHHGHHSSSGSRQVGNREETGQPQDIACSGRRQEMSLRKEIRPQYSTGSRVGQEGSRREAARPQQLSGGRGQSKREEVKPQQHGGRRQEGCKMSLGQTVPPSKDRTSKSPLSEERICEITAKLKGSLPSYTCPICGQQLPSHESEYSAQLHVERCLASQDAEG